MFKDKLQTEHTATDFNYMYMYNEYTFGDWVNSTPF